MIYAHLVAGADAEGREKFDAELYAPVEGWDALDKRLWRSLMEADDAGTS